MLNSSSPSTPISVPRALLVALYVVALAFILPSLMEFLLVSFPYRVGTAQWRFGALGLLFNSVLFSPIIGLTLAALTSVILGHRGVSRTVAVLTGILALVLLLGIPFFILDFLQLRASVNPQVKRAFDFTSLKATITGALMCVTALSVAVGTWRSSDSGAQRATTRAGAARPKAAVVMGSAQAPQG